MTPPKAGTSAAACAHQARPSLTLSPRRWARSIVMRAALRGIVSWHVALPLLAVLQGGAR